MEIKNEVTRQIWLNFPLLEGSSKKQIKEADIDVMDISFDIYDD